MDLLFIWICYSFGLPLLIMQLLGFVELQTYMIQIGRFQSVETGIIQI